jgi:hypothetical protein
MAYRSTTTTGRARRSLRALPHAKNARKSREMYKEATPIKNVY